VDENTGEITAQVLTDNKTDDAAVLVDLVVDTPLARGFSLCKQGKTRSFYKI
jgi:hypothetical protein